MCYAWFWIRGEKRIPCIETKTELLSNMKKNQVIKWKGKGIYILEHTLTHTLSLSLSSSKVEKMNNVYSYSYL